MRKEEKQIEESLKIRCVICADSVLAGDSMYFKGQKGLAHADLAKKLFFAWFFYCFMCDYCVALISALVLLNCGNLRITVVV